MTESDLEEGDLIARAISWRHKSPQLTVQMSRALRSVETSAKNLDQEPEAHHNLSRVNTSSLFKSVNLHASVSKVGIIKICICFIGVTLAFTAAQVQSLRMVRLCIASVDPAKLSSQCVMCNRREFPLTVIDCTGMTKVNELISNPLSVQEATCLIYNCRRQVPEVKPEPYHGSVSSAVRTNHPTAAGSRIYNSVPSSGMFGGYGPGLPLPTRYGGYSGTAPSGVAIPSPTALAATSTRGLVGGSGLLSNDQQMLPYAIVPTPYTSLFGKFLTLPSN